MLLRVLIGAAVGLLIGAMVGSILKSRGGTCPLTCNPIGGAIFGALLGAVLANSFAARKPAGELLADVPGVASVERFDAALASARPVLVDFYTDTCPYCVQLAPTIADLAGRYRGQADVLKVNVADLPELGRRYDIQGVPTVMLFAGGHEVGRWAGVKSMDQYQAALDKAISQAGPEKDERQGQMTERKDVIKFKGNPLTLVGDPVKVGQKMPDFTVLGNDLSEVKLSSFAGKVVILSLVPSLDTPVCSVETRRFNEEASKLGDGVVVLTVSMDLPFAQKRWCAAEGIDRVITASDHRDAAAGKATGMLIKELRLLTRAVFVLDRKGTIVYEQVVPEVTHEPDYEAAIAAAKNVLK